VPSDRALQIAATTLPAIPLDAWRLLEVRSGIPIIEAATVDQFVPQMLNYELVGGVDFQKGCYPGQEVVARSQYRGTIKRRMFLFDLDTPATPGQEVFHSADPGQPAGLVVNAAPRQDGTGASALVEVKLASLATGSLHLGAPTGAILRRAELAYAIPIDDVLTAP
jgi:folate-binding protein YgfZ